MNNPNFVSMKKGHVLVSGGAGYIGSHTVVSLIENGYHPVIVDDLRNAHEKILSGIKKITGKEIPFEKIDVCDLNSLKKTFERYPFEGVIHFAAYKAVGESVESPLKYYKNNIIGLLNILENCISFNVQNFVFSSSCTVYGEPKDVKVVTENSTIQKANSPYGNTKQIGEEIISDLVNSKKSLKAVNLRYFNPVGAHPSANIGELPIGKPANLFPVITQCGIGKIEKITIFGGNHDTIDGTCVRDYVHVMDVADAHVKALNWLEKQERDSIVEYINIGTGKGTSVLEAIRFFEDISGQKINWEMGKPRPGDVVEIYADVTKAKKLLNWEAKYTIKDAVKDAWRWEKKIKND